MASGRMEFHAQTIMQHASFSFVLPNDVEMAEVREPRHYERPTKTLILLHGLTGTDTDWLYGGVAQDMAIQYNLAVFMPAAGNHFYLDHGYPGGDWGRFTGEEFPDYIRKVFGCCDRREDTLIGGLSMGGYGAVRNGLKYRDTFGAILAFSSALITNQYARGELDNPSRVIMPFGYYTYTFGPKEKVPGSETDPAFLAKRAMEGSNRPDLFLACGSEDFLYENNLEFHSALEEMKYPHEWWVEPGVHNFDFWRRAVTAGLAWWAARREGK